MLGADQHPDSMSHSFNESGAIFLCVLALLGVKLVSTKEQDMVQQLDRG